MDRMDVPGSEYAGVYFSQWGEDVILWHFLRDKREGFYVDVGAHHPYFLSNTARLHNFNGWTGINVEPDERLFQEFLRVRPKDINLCCGVGATDGVQKMAIFEEAAVNSFDAESVRVQIAHAGRVPKEWREVPVRTLRGILDEHLPAGRTIDLLNVDAEGLDLVVLESNDWSRYRPGIVLVEDHQMNLMAVENSPTFRFMRDLGYRFNSQTLATSVYTA